MSKEEDWKELEEWQDKQNEIKQKNNVKEFKAKEYRGTEIFTKLISKLLGSVFSSVAPVITFFNFVLTNADPFPGFTCWNSTTLKTFPSISNVVPFLKSPAEYTPAILFLLSIRFAPFIARQSDKSFLLCFLLILFFTFFILLQFCGKINPLLNF